MFLKIGALKNFALFKTPFLQTNIYIYRTPLVAAFDYLVLKIFSDAAKADVFFKKRCSEKFCKIHRKTPVSEPPF